MQIELIRSRRRTISIELTDETHLLVRAPMRMPRHEIDAFVREKEGWIRKQQEKIKVARSVPDAFIDPVTDRELAYLKGQAKLYIPERVAHFAPLVGVTYGRVTIRAQKTCFGSCSAKGNLNFNCVLMRMTPDIVDYVIVHELCHRKHMDHSKAFWAAVEEVLPDYKKRRRWLRDNGRFYVDALPEGGHEETEEYV